MSFPIRGRRTTGPRQALSFGRQGATAGGCFGRSASVEVCLLYGVNPAVGEAAGANARRKSCPDEHDEAHLNIYNDLVAKIMVWRSRALRELYYSMGGHAALNTAKKQRNKSKEQVLDV